MSAQDTGPDHLDALETRSPEQREQDLFAALPGLIAHAKAQADFLPPTSRMLIRHR